MNPQQLGRDMMTHAGDLSDDKQCCDWARVGQILTQLGTPRMPKTMQDLSATDRSIVVAALKFLQHRPARPQE
jgi:hypothetical protein